MKLVFISVLLFLSFSNLLYTAEKERATYANPVTNTVDKKEDLLNSFLEYPAVKPIYESCLKKQKEKSLKTSLAECVWHDVDDQTKKN